MDWLQTMPFLGMQAGVLLLSGLTDRQGCSLCPSMFLFLLYP